MRLAAKGHRLAALPLAVLGAALMLALLFALLAPRVARAGGVVGPCNQSNLATALAGGGSVTFNCGGPATITFASQIVITQDTTIDGGTLGQVTLSGNNVTRLFSTTAGVKLTLLNLTLRDGNAGLNAGGALWAAGPTLIVNSAFISNTATSFGGAIATAGSAAPVTITASLFQHNSSFASGGAVNGAGGVWVTNSDFYSNTAGGGGGLALHAEAQVSGSRFVANLAEGGAGIYTLDAGDVAVSASQFYSNTASKGGAIFAAGPALRLTNSTLHHNSADIEGGALYARNATTISGGEFYSNTSNYGGAISAYGWLTLTSSSLHDNIGHEAAGALALGDGSTLQSAERLDSLDPQATLPGHALLTDVDIYNNLADAAQAFSGGVDAEGVWAGFERVRIFDNHVITGFALYGGGGLGVFYGTAILTDSAVYGNVLGAGPGGGIHASYGATLTLVTSAVYSNAATAGQGGGISALSDNGVTRLRIYNSTVSGNSAQTGGGVYLDAANFYAVLSYTTLYGNLAPVAANFTGTMELYGSIVAGSGGLNCGGAVKSFGYNLEDADTCTLGAPGDITGTNPLLGPLGWNGGPTWTHAPLAGSPVIDAADAPLCPPTDQRGAARPVDGDSAGGAQCDMGAYEFGALIGRLFLPLLLR